MLLRECNEAVTIISAVTNYFIKHSCINQSQLSGEGGAREGSRIALRTRATTAPGYARAGKYSHFYLRACRFTSCFTLADSKTSRGLICLDRIVGFSKSRSHVHPLIAAGVYLTKSLEADCRILLCRLRDPTSLFPPSCAPSQPLPRLPACLTALPHFPRTFTVYFVSSNST